MVANHRLQRPPDFTGGRIDRFGQVWARHGAPGLALAIAALLLPGGLMLFIHAVQPAIDEWPRYLLGATAIGVGLCLYAQRANGQLAAPQFAWVAYLGALSVWEEWVFRVALPSALDALGLSLLAAIVLSNLLFGAAHYVTLRWKWYWCAAAALGGMALSRVYGNHQDLAWIAALHWVGTFINTPRLPVPAA